MTQFASWVLAFFVLVETAYAAEVIVVESKDSTSKDIPLKFTLEKSTWDGKNIEIWGTVKNPGTDIYQYVKVILTARDDKGGFIGRNAWSVEPTDVGAGQSSYLQRHVVCEMRKPATIEFSVTGERK